MCTLTIVAGFVCLAIGMALGANECWLLLLAALASATLVVALTSYALVSFISA